MLRVGIWLWRMRLAWLVLRYADVTAMSRLEAIENQVKELDSRELESFRQWFAEFDAEIWDRQFESDVESGRLDQAAERVLRDHDAGRSTEW
jgi:hypothetical protein